MKVEVKIIAQCTCYTTLEVKGKKHIVPTIELIEWIEYFSKGKND